MRGTAPWTPCRLAGGAPIHEAKSLLLGTKNLEQNPSPWAVNTNKKNKQCLTTKG